MFEKIKEKRKAKKERKKIKPGQLKQLTANGSDIKAFNIHIFSEGEEGIFRIVTPEESAALHYEEISFIIETEEKKMKLTGKFRGASQEKSFYIYEFIIQDYKEFFA